MDIHKNACLAPLGRERRVKMVLGGQTLEAVSEAVGVSQRTVRKWVGLYENEGLVGLEDDRCPYSERHRPSSPPHVRTSRVDAVSQPRAKHCRA
jgi:transposase-like protein